MIEIISGILLMAALLFVVCFAWLVLLMAVSGFWLTPGTNEKDVKQRERKADKNYD